MKILQASSEAVPFCKTGGLADVVGALCRKLGTEGHDVCLFLPKYRSVDTPQVVEGMSVPIEVPLGGGTARASLRYLQWKSVSVYFVDHPESFDRAGLYGEGGKDYPDNDRRFVLFSRAVMEGARSLGFKPDVIHLHDWETALIAVYRKTLYRDDPHFAGASTLLSIHNMAYQGVFPRESFALTGLPEDEFTGGRLEFGGKVGFLKGGIVSADLVSTVSPAYAREIRTGSGGFGLEGVMASRGDDLCGILNGVDYEAWNPQTDAHIAKRYSFASFGAGKASCKADLQARCGFPVKRDVPLIGMVSRLDRQKGLDLAVEALRPRLDRAQVVILGVGCSELADTLARFARGHPGAVFFNPDFDEPMVHRIYSGADVFLMPSRFEPCGLGQIIAMRYGAVPVASRTGGLSDTVFEEPRPQGTSSSGTLVPNGFLAEPGDAPSLGRAVDRALAAYAGPAWTERVRAGMACDFSWDRSTALYLDLYCRSRRTGSFHPGKG